MKHLVLNLLAVTPAAAVSIVKAPVAARSPAQPVVSFLEKSKPAEKEDSLDEPLHFGDTRCPCIGIDNVEGEVVVTLDLKDEKKKAVVYPKDLGSRCEAWDKGVHPTCGPGSKEEFCKSRWCYVDACNCDVHVLPDLSLYLPDARYRGRPLFFSYATCGSKKDFLVEEPEFGQPGCQCVGFHGVRGSITIHVSEGKTAKYPASIGGTCKAWDKDEHPLCTGSKDEPSWCPKRWCYVDACACKLAGGHVPKISKYLPDATFTGKAFYYSYETCNSEDTFTKKYHPHACVNQANQTACDSNHRCAWTGIRCLGRELVEHPLCEDMVSSIKQEAIDLAKSGASSRLAFAGLAAVAAILGFV